MTKTKAIHLEFFEFLAYLNNKWYLILYFVATNLSILLSEIFSIAAFIW